MYAQLATTEEEKRPSQASKTRNDQRLISLRECGEARSPPDRVQCTISCNHTKVILVTFYCEEGCEKKWRKHFVNIW